MKLTKGEFLYFMFFGIMTFGEMLNLDTAGILYILLVILSLMCISIKTFFESYKLRELILLGFLLITSLFLFLHSHAISMVFTIISLVALKNVSIEKLLKFILRLRIILFISIILCSFLGVLKNHVFLIERMTGEITWRHSLGFEHANILHANFFIIVALYLYINFEKISYVHLGVIFISNYLLNLFSMSRTGFYITLLAMVCFVVLRMMAKKDMIISRIFILLVPICGITSVLASKFYPTTEVLSDLNRLLQGRISNGHYYMQLYNPRLFGTLVELDDSGLILDNSFVILWLNLGVVAFLGYILAYVLLMGWAIEHKDYALILLISMFSLYGITEGFLPNLFINVSLIFMGKLLYKEKKTGSEVE